MSDYNKSKFTLKYKNKNMEVDYLVSIFDAKRLQMLFVMGLTFLIYFFYILLDYLILSEEERYMIVTFHASMIGLWIYLIGSIYYNICRKLAIFILHVMPIYAILGTFLFAYYYNSIYVVEIYIILFWALVSIGYMFLESVLVSSVMVMLSVLILSTFNIFNIQDFTLHIFFMVGAWALGLFAAYIIELYSRRNFENKLELLQLTKELKEQANRDYLTNLYNRRYFNEIAQDFIKVGRREKKQMSVIMLDIDKFKNINDTYGHGTGDKVIKELASLLRTSIRDSDIVSRFGGEEFVILLPFTDKVGALKTAEELRISVENKNIKVSDDKYIKFTISLGVDCIDYNEDMVISEALNRADKALYKAKESGRNKTEIS